MQLQGMNLNSFFLDTIDREAIKVEPTPTIKTAFLAMSLRQKLSRPFYKSNVNNISHCQACLFKLKFPWQKNVQVFHPLHYKDSSARPFYLITGRHMAL